MTKLEIIFFLYLILGIFTCAQDLLMGSLTSGTTVDSARLPDSTMVSATCKANALTSVLPLWPVNIINYSLILVLGIYPTMLRDHS